MKRNITVGLVWAAIAAVPLLGAAQAQAQGRDPSREAPAQATLVPPSLSDISAQSRSKRPPTRLRVYPRYAPDAYGVTPRYFPGRNAVRDCTATYVEEYRPSGTVIVPRMSCFWRRG